MKRISIYILLLCTFLSISNISFGMENFFKGAASFFQNVDKGLEAVQEKRDAVRKYIGAINKIIDVEEAKKIIDGYDEKIGLNFDDIKKIISCIRTKPILYLLRNQIRTKVVLTLVKQFDLTEQELSNIKLELLPQCFDFKKCTFHFDRFKAAVGIDNLDKIAKQTLNKLCKIYNIPQENIKRIIDHETLLTVFLNTGKLNTKMLKACIDNDEGFYQLLKAFSLQNAMDISVLEKSVDIEVLKFDKIKIIESIKTKEFAQWLLKSLKLEGRAPLAITQEVIDSAKYLVLPQQRKEEDPKILFLEKEKEEEEIKKNIFLLGKIDGARVTSYGTLAAYSVYSLFVNPFFYWTLPVAYGSYFAISSLVKRGNKYLINNIKASANKAQEANEILTAKNRLEYWLFKFAESVLESFITEKFVTDEEAKLKKDIDATKKETAASAGSSSEKASAANAGEKYDASFAGLSSEVAKKALAAAASASATENLIRTAALASNEAESKKSIADAITSANETTAKTAAAATAAQASAEAAQASRS